MQPKGKYISPEKYRKMYPGIGIETIKKMLRNGKLAGYIDEDPDTKFTHYYILVDENGNSKYSEEYVKELERKLACVEEKLRNVNVISAI